MDETNNHQESIMTKRSLLLAALGLALAPAIAAYAGNWAVVTVEDLPDHIVAGEPVVLSYTVRQHGVERISGLRGEVEAEAGRLSTRAVAAAGRGRGEYRATLTPPAPGEWTITIRSGFGNSRATLLPITAVARGAAARPVAESERGRRLFVAKGCITCHTHGDVKAAGGGRVGPELTGRRLPADYLAQFLANPAIRASAEGNRMPNLELDRAEIAALVTFINTERQALAR
jgi:mono/diheme cytochrome c family protein